MNDPICCKLDCGDVEKLRDALREVVDERWSELDMMRCSYRRGTSESEAWHEGVKEMWRMLKLIKQPAIDALAATGKPLSAQPAEPVHDQLRMRRPVWTCPTCQQKFYTSAEYDAHRALEDVLRVHDKEVVEAKSPSDVSDAAYKAVNAFRAALAAPSGVKP